MLCILENIICVNCNQKLQQNHITSTSRDVKARDETQEHVLGLCIIYLSVYRVYLSAHLKYGILKPGRLNIREINECACARVSFSVVQSSEVYKSHILYGPIQ